jgi:hypothetical protein
VESELVGELPNRSLADAIRLEIQEANAAAISAVEHARRAGELLLEAKAACAHGEWNRWLAANVDVSDRTARLYMQLARHWNQLSQPERQRVTDLRLGQVIQEMRGLLTNADPEAAEEEEPTPADLHAERLKLERVRAQEMARDCKGSLQHLMASLGRLPLPESEEDFKVWSAVLLELSSTAENLGREFEDWNMRVEVPPPEASFQTRVGTRLTVCLAPDAEDLADITSQELFDLMGIYRRNQDHVTWCYQSESEDIGIMKPEGWCIEPQPPGPGYHRWQIAIEQPGKPQWIRGFWSKLGARTRAVSDVGAAEGGRKPRTGWVSWGPP